MGLAVWAVSPPARANERGGKLCDPQGFGDGGELEAEHALSLLCLCLSLSLYIISLSLSCLFPAPSVGRSALAQL